MIGVCLILLVLLFGLPLFACIVSAVIAMLERRPVWPFAVPEEIAEPIADSPMDDDNPYAAPHTNDPNPPLTEYVAEKNHFAETLGLSQLGEFRDGRGKHHRIRYDFWLSPERDILAVIGGGKLGPLSLRGMALFTHLHNGRALATVNSPAFEVDLSGMEDQAYVGRAELDKLLHFHRRRLSVVSDSCTPFSEEDPLGDFREFGCRQIEQLVEYSYARYLDPEKTAWRYTLLGAINLAFWSYFVTFRRTFLPDRFRFALRHAFRN